MNKNNFWRQVFTDKDGNPSSKRLVLFALLSVFITVVLVNLYNGKTLSATLGEQLFYLVIYALAAVFGENVTSIFVKKKPEDGFKAGESLPGGNPPPGNPPSGS